MAYTDGGIDNQVNQKVDAYRQNPQALQQRYQQNNELLDLLALQKIKSEKESVANEMKMAMQQSPKTIAQQREAEVLDLTKKEMGRNLGEVTKEVGGTAQQQQAVQQKNMQRMAAAGPQPQPRPQAGPQQAMPNMPRMAGGGIVAFQNGGGVGGGARGAAAAKLLAGLQLTPQQYQALPPEGKRQVQQALQSQAAPQQQQQAMPNMARMPRMAGGGIVSFAEGGQAEDLKKALASVGETLESYQNMSPQQQNLVKQTIQGKSNNSSYLNRLLAIPAAFSEGRYSIKDFLKGKAGQVTRDLGIIGAGETLFDSEKIPQGASKFPATSGLLAPKPPVNLDGLNRPNAVAGTGIAGGQDDNGYPDDPLPSPPPMAPVAPPPAPFAAPEVRPTTALEKAENAGLGSLTSTGNRATFKNPLTTPEGIENTKSRQDLLAKSIKQSERNPVEEAKARQVEVGKLLRRDESAASYDKYISGIEALQQKQLAEDRRNPFAGLRTRNTALGRMGIGTEENRQSINKKERDDLETLYSMTKEREKADFDRAGAQVTAGTAALQLGETAIAGARRDAASLVANRSDELTAVAKGFLEADKANMTAETAERRDRIMVAISMADNVVKTDIANLEGSIQTERLKLESKKIDTLDAGGKRDLLSKTMALTSKLKSGYTAILQKAIEAESFGKNPEEKNVITKRLTGIYTQLAEDSVADLVEFADTINEELGGADAGFKVNSR